MIPLLLPILLPLARVDRKHGGGGQAEWNDIKETMADQRPHRQQFIINAQQPASDKIFDVFAFEKFLNERIKVEGRTGNLGDIIKISHADGKVEIVAHNELSGRYLKYLYVSTLLSPGLKKTGLPWRGDQLRMCMLTIFGD